MENKDYKFRAWFPELKLMLYGIAIYGDGIIGISADTFERELQKCNPNFYIDWDDASIMEAQDDLPFGIGDRASHIMNFLPGDEWMQFEGNDFVIMQFILQNIEQKDIYEQDIVSRIVEIRFVEDIFESLWLFDDYFSGRNCKIIGNKYQNPELLNEA